MPAANDADAAARMSQNCFDSDSAAAASPAARSSHSEQRRKSHTERGSMRQTAAFPAPEAAASSEPPAVTTTSTGSWNSTDNKQQQKQRPRHGESFWHDAKPSELTFRCIRLDFKKHQPRQPDRRVCKTIEHCGERCHFLSPHLTGRRRTTRRFPDVKHV